MNKPNLFIVGMPKAGTTSLYGYLRQHPDVFMSRDKEPHFFCKKRLYWGKRKYKNLSQYLKLFKEAENEKIIGEASTNYIISDKAVRKIKRFNPGAKIIIMLRDPVEWISSMHNHLYYSAAIEDKKLQEALEEEKSRLENLKKPWDVSKEQSCYKHTLRKAYNNVGKWLDEFGEDSVKIILLGDLKENTGKVYKEVCEFLGISSSFNLNFSIQNKGISKVESRKLRKFKQKVKRLPRPIFRFLRYIIPTFFLNFIRSKNLVRGKKREIPKDLKREIRKEFKEDIIKLEKVINRDLSHWIEEEND